MMKMFMTKKYKIIKRIMSMQNDVVIENRQKIRHTLILNMPSSVSREEICYL